MWQKKDIKRWFSRKFSRKTIILLRVSCISVKISELVQFGSVVCAVGWGSMVVFVVVCRITIVEYWVDDERRSWGVVVGGCCWFLAAGCHMSVVQCWLLIVRVDCRSLFPLSVPSSEWQGKFQNYFFFSLSRSVQCDPWKSCLSKADFDAEPWRQQWKMMKVTYIWE